MSAMYLTNKYTTWYNNIICRAKSRTLPETGYSEKHHIIPKSLGGNNSKGNLVTLTAREHYICHLLLPKMTTGKDRSKMAYALHRMLSGNNRRYLPKSKIYEIVRKSIKSMLLGRVFTESTLQKMSLAKKGKPKPDDIANRLRTARTGLTNSDEHKQKCSDALTGRVFTDQWKKKLSDAHQFRVTVCPHCGLSGHSLNMKRWHIPRCSPLPNPT